MSMSDIGLFNGLIANMKHLNQRQQVIGENIANADTDNYRARDVETPNFSKLIGGPGDGKIRRPTVSATSRMAALGSKIGVGGHIFQTTSDEAKANGNNVVIEDEVLKMGNVRADYNAMSSLYRKSMNLLKIATTGR